MDAELPQDGLSSRVFSTMDRQELLKIGAHCMENNDSYNTNNSEINDIIAGCGIFQETMDNWILAPCFQSSRAKQWS